jgi:hypothetical protein
MSNKPYKRKPGDFEVRILSDGRVVMVAPDEELIEIVRNVDSSLGNSQPITESKNDVTREKTETKESNSK